jgi:hypothetical protein
MKSSSYSYFGASNGFMDKRDPKNTGDYYPTPPIATYSLLKNHKFDEIIWEPAAGKGHISKEIERMGYKCKATDLYDRGEKSVEPHVDFLNSNIDKNVKGIITNPPYKDGLAEAFLVKALSFNIQTVALLCRLQFIAGIGRYNNIYKNNPPSKVLIFPRRIMCDEGVANNEDSTKQFGGMLEYAWFIWDKNVKTHSQTVWLDVDTLSKNRNKEINKISLETFFDD